MHKSKVEWLNLGGKKKEWFACWKKSKDNTGDNDITIMPVDELPRKNSMALTMLLLLMGNVGSGVVTLPYAFHKIGLIPGIVGCILMALLSRYTGVLLCRVFVAHQECTTMGDLALIICGPRYSRVVYTIVYFYIFVTLAFYLVVASTALQDIQNMCIYSAALYLSIAILGFGQLRTLGEIGYLGILAFATIFIVLLLSLYEAWEYSDGATYNMFKIESPYDFFSAFGTIGFAYCGQIYYTEYMFEMLDPREFVCSLNIAVTIMFFTYTLVGALGYYFLGDTVSAYLPDIIPVGGVRYVASVLMVFHLLFSMMPKIQILTRVMHQRFDARSADAFHQSSDMYWRGRGFWFLSTVIIFILMFLVVNTVPYFDDLVELMGCLLDPMINYFTPTCLFWFLVRRDHLFMSNVTKMIWFFAGIFVLGLLYFGTADAVSDWLNHTADIWTCN